MKGNERTWTAYGSVIDGDVIWYVNYRGTLLCGYSLSEKRMKKVEVIPYSGNRSQLLYSNIIKADSTLILIPANAHDLCLYDIKTGIFEKVLLNVPADSFNIFCGAAVWKDSVYLLPYNYRYIVKLNLITKLSENVCDLHNIVRMEPKRGAFQYNYVQNGQKMFFVSAVENKILCFDMETENVIVKSVGETDTVFSALSLFEDGRLAAIDWSGRIYIISEDLESWEVRSAVIDSCLWLEEGKAVKPYADCIYADHKVFFFPAYTGLLLEYKKEQKTLKGILVDDNEKTDYEEAEWSDGIKFSLVHEWNGKICGFYSRTGKLFIFDPANRKIEFYVADSYLGEEESRGLLKRMIEQGAVAEGDHSYDSLETFVKVIQE